MSENFYKSIVICEGSTDKIIFEDVLKKIGLTEKIEVNKEPSHGKWEAIGIFKSFIKALSPRLVFIELDLDDKTPEELYKEVDECIELNSKNGVYNYNNCTGVVIPVGLEFVRERWGVNKLAIEDYILSLISIETVFENFKNDRKGHGTKIEHNHKDIIEKMNEIIEISRNQKFHLNTSKACLEIFMAITGVQVSIPSLSRLLIQATDEKTIKEIFSNILDIFNKHLEKE